MKRDEITVQRWLFFGLVLSTTAAATTRLLAVFRIDDLSMLDAVLITIFALLFAWISTSFWIACLGTHASWRGRTQDLPRPPASGKLVGELACSRTALIAPIYNENSNEVFSRLQAIQDSLRKKGAQSRFDFFVLSDSSDSHCRTSEKNAWRQFRGRNTDTHIYYRNRDCNHGRKSGNIADFCRNWGALYDYMVVLDADSIMTGDALTELVRLMEANPKVALIQVPPQLVGCESLFARIQQFASWVYGPIYVAGLARLTGPDGNYWGHNAIIRVKPFMENCGLPVLRGRPPLGGEIMSHDFVEAALLRRGGWEVWLAHDIKGSYESSPPTLVDYLKRDRRWCQGNLQHIKLIFAQGLRMSSRLHFALGAMSYLSSPLCLLLILLFITHAVRIEHAAPVTYVGRYPELALPVSHTLAFVSLAIAALGLLIVPKIMSAIVLLRNNSETDRFGGSLSVIVSLLIEIVLSILLAPIFMLAHSWFVLNILVGRNTRWATQPRATKGITLGRALIVFFPYTLIAIGAGVIVWQWIPNEFWWCLPLFVGPAGAIILGWITSKPSWGSAARYLGVFLIPSETAGLPIVNRVQALLAEERGSNKRIVDETIGRAEKDLLTA